ncbi:hypothetical protein [Hymenobacter wooponensis]|uniref:Uncharacterized protein n=1 Tax=Hymenobacter wooponensis TaxID=1525360 RepID=A0A4Z0MLG7_9BACT|nr:hypothetical protein [Hymenobacter wooponensis]TGD80464.1 hypothetical protein EU557_11545 [Hymenobacter wooponensis]
MSANFPPNDEQNNAMDPAQLGADQGPGSSPEEDPRDMSTVLANAGNYRDEIGVRTPEDEHGRHSGSPQMERGSDFDQQRREGAAGDGDNSRSLGRGQGMGRTGFNSDEDRGYDQSGHRGGLGTSGGRDDLSNRNPAADQNAFTGGYGGGDYDQPDETMSQRIGMNSRNPTDEPPQAQHGNAVNESE